MFNNDITIKLLFSIFSKKKKDSITTIYFKPHNLNTLSNSIENSKYEEESEFPTPYFYVVNKTKDELKWEVFSSLQGLRDQKYYNNIQDIQDYFVKKYNMCFFKNNEICKIEGFYHLFNKNGINYGDFLKIILPNIKISFFKEYDLNPPKFEGEFLVVFNWEFFKDINDYSFPNISYTYTDYGYPSKKMNLQFMSYAEVICYVFDYLFELPFYRPDAIIKGLNFAQYDKYSPIIDKYFKYQKDRNNKVYNHFIPKTRGWQLVENEEDMQNNFKEILHFFEEENIGICKILPKK